MTKSHKERRHNEIGPHKIDDVSQRRTYPNFATEKIEENKLKISKYFLFFFISLYLIERLNFGVHDKWKFAQFARVRFGRGQPLLQTRLMDKFEAARAIAWRQQRIVRITFTVTYSTDVATVL